MTLATLKALAAKLNCEIEDDKENATLYVHASGDKAWEGGVLTALVHPYGSCGSYVPAWRATAIKEAHERLTEYGAPEDNAEEV